MCDNGFAWTDKGLHDKNIFQCKGCSEIYHRKCMYRDNNCSVCQIKNINPLQKSL
jgi:hypothetical protein